MTAITSVLVPVDFGDASARAITVAGRIAEAAGARLLVLHAEPIDAPAYFTHEQVEALAAQRRNLRHRAESYLEAFVRRHTDAPFAAVISQASPTEAVGQHAGTADLVVMGTHGRRGPSRWWMGSVAERVLWAIDRPLMVVRAGDDRAPLFTEIAVYAAPPLTGEPARAFADALARTLGSPVVDRRREPGPPAPVVDAASLAVVAAPLPHSRPWQHSVGEPLVRAAHAVLFVPESETRRTQ
jgi:nucleotide-binding universal stress UspA family protein